MKQLNHIQAKILVDSPKLMRAELKKPMQVELVFSDGKLERVNYAPQ